MHYVLFPCEKQLKYTCTTRWRYSVAAMVSSVQAMLEVGAGAVEAQLLKYIIFKAGLHEAVLASLTNQMIIIIIDDEGRSATPSII